MTRVLLVGGGGREHALAWSLRNTELFVSPGNAGILSIAQDGVTDLESFARTVDLVVVGPEAPLAEGIVDRLRGVSVFGPSARAAEIEASKVFSKELMARHGIPTARFAVASSLAQARSALRDFERPVLKYSGLAAGKGVMLPDTPEELDTCLKRLFEEREFGDEPVLIEERLEGREVSLMAFCDGRVARPMLPARDHKRVLENDQGPNTGGMGAVCPVPGDVEFWTSRVLQPVVEAMAAEGRPFVGVLYAGLMLTAGGPQVLEFNCRFGDPETQVVVPLLETPLVEVVQACCEGRLGEVDLRWRAGAAACVVMTAQGYPGAPRQGDVIHGLSDDLEGTLVFHAGTRQVGEEVVTAGGRVLGVVGLGRDLPEALGLAYARVERISFAGAHYRKDIGR